MSTRKESRSEADGSTRRGEPYRAGGAGRGGNESGSGLRGDSTGWKVGSEHLFADFRRERPAPCT